ncbi:MAG TPA: hypothetical protein VN442_17100 [Bryobacteraceae bacterium]|nr:hypothetical protein [Bryobacteraceae bacterium]
MRATSFRTSHTSLRIHTELRAPAYGGVPESLKTDAGVTVPLTFVPEFPMCPPEAARMRQPRGPTVIAAS